MPAFIARVKAGVDEIVAAADHEDTVAVFSHGGVINALVHDIMGTERLLCAQVDYAGVTRLLWSSQRGGSSWQESTRPNTYGICCRETSSGRQVR